MSILSGLSASAIVMEIRQYSWDRNYAQNPVKENLILYVFEHHSWSQVVNYLRLEYTKHTIFNTHIWHSRTSLRVVVCPEELNLACSLWQFYWGAKGIVCTVTMFSYSQCRFLAFHSISVDYFRIIWLAVAVAAKGTLVAGVVAAETVADVALCIMGTVGMNAVCCCSCALVRACW